MVIKALCDYYNELAKRGAVSYQDYPSEEVVRQCSVYGKELPIARVHNRVRYIPGGKFTGNSLICFNNSAEWSYGHKQAHNCNVSEMAMHKYTGALNHMISEKKYRVRGGVTYFNWTAAGETYELGVRPNGSRLAIECFWHRSIKEDENE